ncbi:MAG: hypothetical protein GW949_05405 [Spirochaetales bacterium]|nr:hypothetical protein [Spirochaetales bacterium]
MKRRLFVWIFLSVLSSLFAGGSGLGYLALGDSYTIGQGVSEDERWPAQVARILEEEGGYEVEVVYRARTGWATGNLLQSLRNTEPVGRFDLVTLLIGVNNQFQGQNLAVFEQECTSLLDLAISYAGGDPTKVKVLSIPLFSPKPGEDFDRN